MGSKNCFLLALLMAASGCTSSGNVTDSTDKPGLADNQGDNSDDVICRQVEVTGSHFRRRLCMTRAEFAEASRQTQDTLDESGRTLTSPQ